MKIKRIKLTREEVARACRLASRYFADLPPHELVEMTNCAKCVAGRIGRAVLLEEGRKINPVSTERLDAYDRGIAKIIDIFGVERFRGTTETGREHDIDLVGRLSRYLVANHGIGHGTRPHHTAMIGTSLEFYFPGRPQDESITAGNRWDCTAMEMAAFWKQAAASQKETTA